jgi:hypothetical protein
MLVGIDFDIKPRYNHSMKKIPRWLQPTLWSVRVKNLDLEKDKVYVINQILAYGGFNELKWLFKTYSTKILKNIFIEQPLKIYSPSGFNFVKEILLGLEDIKLNLHGYDKNLPRYLRH